MNIKPERFSFFSIFAISLIVFLAHLSYTKTALYSDTRFYFAYTRSLVKDFDLNLTNDYKILGIISAQNRYGLAVNTYSPGASLLWIPGYWIADQFVHLYQIIFNLPPPTGLEIAYQVFSGLASIFLGTVGLFLVNQTLKKYFSHRVSLLTTITIFTTTNLFFYMAVEPLTSHSASFFAISAFVYYFLKPKKGKSYYLKLGLLAGLAGLIRPQNLAILALPTIHLILKRKKHFKNLATSYFLLATGSLIAFSPQIVLWKLFFNVYFTGPSWGYGFNFARPQILHVLFNTQNGLFILTPAVGIAVVALLSKFLKFIYLKSIGNWQLETGNSHSTIILKVDFYALLYFCIQLYIVSSWAEYFQGGSYSIRMLVNTYPLLAFGVASIFVILVKKIKLSRILFLIGCFSLLNTTLIIRYLLLY